MLENLITSKTRIKLLLKFFLNSKTTAYLRHLETEFSESTNAIRLELNRFEKAGLLVSKMIGNKKVYQANTKHILFDDIHNILCKHVGIDRIIEDVIERIGNLEKAFVIGAFANGLDSKIIDLIFIGEQFNLEYLAQLVRKTERLIKLKIRYIVLEPKDEAQYLNENEEAMLIWSRGAE